jgi:hypothetical protein
MIFRHELATRFFDAVKNVNKFDLMIIKTFDLQFRSPEIRSIDPQSQQLQFKQRSERNRKPY